MGTLERILLAIFLESSSVTFSNNVYSHGDHGGTWSSRRRLVWVCGVGAWAVGGERRTESQD